MADFQRWIQFLENKGYSNYWQDLNAKNYGVAQNRNRCFMVSILGNHKYEFPKPIPLTKTMKDYLEDVVDEKYYINNEKAQKLIDTLISDGTIPRAEQSRRECLRQCIDLTINQPRCIDVANCITTQYRGIKNYRADDNGVVERHD